MPDHFTPLMFSMFRNDSGVMADLEYGPVGITPGMKFHSPLMCFCNHKFQRVIKRNRCFTLLTSQPLAPGFQCRRKKCVTCRPHLYDYSIHAVAQMHIQLADKFLLLQFSTVISRTGPVNIIDRCNPNCSEFIFGLGKCSERIKKQTGE